MSKKRKRRVPMTRNVHTGWDRHWEVQAGETAKAYERQILVT